MATPRPRLDLFIDSPRLLSKKCRTSTPLLRPPKPPKKTAVKYLRRSCGYLDTSTTSSTSTSPPTPTRLSKTTTTLHLRHAQCRLFNQFEVISKIGSGDFADVYQAKSHIDGQYYAIKRTSIPFTSNSDRLRKLQEVRNHQLLPPHPNCVKYYDSWEEDGYLYIQTELCKTSLNDIIENNEDHKLPEHIVWNYLLDLLAAVKHLHDHDLIHMDIKPDNIFISFDGIAKLGDFGLMCSCLDLNSSTITEPDLSNRSDESIDSIDEGDSKYLASEAMQGKFTKAADIFSLGITIFEVSSGLDLPKQGKVYHKLRHNEIDDLYFNGLSADLVKIIKLMMEEDYTKRPTVDDLLQLDAIRSSSPNSSF